MIGGLLSALSSHAAKAGASHVVRATAGHAAKAGASHVVRAGTHQATQATAVPKASQATQAPNSSVLKSTSLIAGPILTDAIGNLLSDAVKDLVKKGVAAVNNRKSE